MARENAEVAALACAGGLEAPVLQDWVVGDIPTPFFPSEDCNPPARARWKLTRVGSASARGGDFGGPLDGHHHLDGTAVATGGGNQPRLPLRAVARELAQDEHLVTTVGTELGEDAGVPTKDSPLRCCRH